MHTASSMGPCGPLAGSQAAWLQATGAGVWDLHDLLWVLPAVCTAAHAARAAVMLSEANDSLPLHAAATTELVPVFLAECLQGESRNAGHASGACQQQLWLH